MVDRLRLPFKTLLEQEHYEKIGSEEIGVLHLRKYGCLLLDEELGIKAIEQESSNSQIDTHLEIATFFLKSRHDPQWTKDKVKDALKSKPLLDSLISFINNERNQWAPFYQVSMEGSGAKQAAIAYAKEMEMVVLGREDLPFTFIVVKVDDVPQDILLQWKVVESFSKVTPTVQPSKKKAKN